MKPAKYMEEIEFRDKNVDGTKFFELKYFLTNDQIEAKLKEFGSFIAQRNGESLPQTPTNDDVIKSRNDHLAMAKTIPTEHSHNISEI